MLLFTERAEPGEPVTGIARLAYEFRQRSRLRVQLIEGELAGQVVGFDLARGTVLRGGDCVRSAQGAVVRVEAAEESLAHLVAGSASELARVAYHLGNRHVPVQVGDGWLRIQRDHVLERMVSGLGAQVSHLAAAFEPEAGAYGGGAHSHAHGAGHTPEPGHSPGDGRHAPKIHDLLETRGGAR